VPNDLLPARAFAEPMLPFDEDDIERCFPGQVGKARSYQWAGKVRDLHADKGGQRLIASVRGTRPRPYHVFVEIGSRDPVDLTAQCSCPVHRNCKHGAAVLLEALHNPPGFEPVVPDPLTGPVGIWLDQLARAAGAAPAPEELAYRLDLPQQPGGSFMLDLRVVRRLKTGEWGAERPVPLQQLSNPTAKYVQAEDRAVLHLIPVSAVWQSQLPLPGDPDLVDLLLQRMLATGRCRWRRLDSPPLGLGAPVPGRLTWHLGADGRQTVGIELENKVLTVLPAAAPWYLDPQRSVAGPIAFDVPRMLVKVAIAAPPVTVDEAAAIAGRLARDLPGLPLPPPRANMVEEVRIEKPTPVLRLGWRERAWNYWDWRRQSDEEVIAAVLLGFAYGGTPIDRDKAPRELRSVEDGKIIVRRRDPKAERVARKRLEGFGLTPVGIVARGGEGGRTAFGFPDDQGAWPQFLYDGLPQLEREGWRIEAESDFEHRVVDGSAWVADVEERAAWWFSLDLGVEIDGQTVPLLPVLTSLLTRLRNPGAPDALDQVARDGTVFGTLPDGRHIALPLDRTRAILSTLVELYHPDAAGGGRIEISAGAAVGLAAADSAIGLTWRGGERLRMLASRLADFGGIAKVEPPSGLKTQLRPYQYHGLDWLQFLREYELGGVLADDMGLGKTVQTLAHLLVEKREGRLDRPCLVVCPTSVVPNWLAEAARLAPELRVLSLHGHDRGERFAAIGGADLVVTTYALLPRDADQLLPIEWHVAVLDEAQAIKNAAAKTSSLACRLRARQRLCLTGTPMENHLGELWSLFAFLMPTLLGDAKRFSRVFRTPIEKKQDGERRSALAQRLKPFLLRRTKALVAADLPPKTEILRPLELAGAQRDLYETVRLAMHEKVRGELAAKGFARSHIVVLDALLKLRQVCCDPRLVKLAAARRITASAKLDHLMEMLPALVEDGRRILLFSQFTSMLDLIKPALKAAGIEFVELRGATTDRVGPVKRFQAGEVPLFLISLKAGGTGLNLTAADTVIHYDPWWNPAVEDQATDRAHRIGQDKPVFVYKLVSQGTVEERILDLQQRKKALAAGIYADGGNAAGGLEAADIEHLFAPIG
jgi:superfamily II DNA or RNA helicase